MGGASADLHQHESDIELTHAERTDTKLGASESKAANDVGLDSGIKSQAEAEGHFVEVTMDIHGDSVALHSVKAFGGVDVVEEEGEKLGLTGKRFEKKKSFSASVVQSAAIRMKQLKRLTSFSKPAPKHFERTKSAVAHALTGLKFISTTDGGEGWIKAEERFKKFVGADGYLPRARFAECLGI